MEKFKYTLEAINELRNQVELPALKQEDIKRQVKAKYDLSMR